MYLIHPALLTHPRVSETAAVRVAKTLRESEGSSFNQCTHGTFSSQQNASQ